MNRDKTSKAIYSEAYRFVLSGNHAQAEPLLRQLLEAHPRHADVLHLIGLVYMESHRIEESVCALKDAVAQRPDQARYQYHYGLALAQKGDLDKAVKAFHKALTLDGDFHDAHYNLAKSFKEQGDLEKSATVYEKLLEKEPLHSDALYNLANLRFEMDMMQESERLFKQLLSSNPQHMNASRTEEAIGILEKALSIKPHHEGARLLLQKLYSNKIPAWHFDMLNDEERNDAYDRAIQVAVAGADHVLEIGTGSGLLSMMAARAGVKTVTTCEMSRPLADVAKKVIDKNGFSDRIKVINKKSTQLKMGVDLSEPADVLIAEVFDNGLLGEHFLPALLHAKKNLLKKNAIIIPAAAKVYATLIECPQLRRINPIGNIAGFDLSDFHIFHDAGYQQVILKNIQHKVLCDPVVVCQIDFERDTFSSSKNTTEIQINQDGFCQAVAFWFELDLWKDIKLSTFDDSFTNHWKQALQFLKNDLHVVQGEVKKMDVIQQTTGLSFAIN